MIALLMLGAIVALVWALNAPGQQFLPGFARLLTAPAIHKEPLSFFSGRSDATGRFKDREVRVRLQLKRSEHGLGYLVVAVRTTGRSSLTYNDIDARARDVAARRALHEIALHDLVISMQEGWLKAEWCPRGFMVFPGQFSEAKWRQVLESMNTLATSLEAAA